MIDREPIFITGLAHSGKTPLRIALEELESISFTRKTYLWRRYHSRYGDLGDPKNLEKLFSAMAADPALNTLEVDYSEVQSEFLEGPVAYSRLFGLLHSQSAKRGGKERWGVQESGIERFADELFEIWPRARIVHLVRDPRQGLPVRAQRSAGRLGWHTARWIASTEQALTHRRRFPHRYLVVRYEELIEDPERMLREICSFIGESFIPGMDAAFARPGLLQDREHARNGAVALQGPFLAFVEGQAGERLEALGYPLQAAADAPRPYPGSVGLLGMAAWRFVGSWRESAS